MESFSLFGPNDEEVLGQTSTSAFGGRMLSGTGPTGLSGLPLSTIKRPRRARRLLATQAGASTLSGSMVSDVSYLSTGPAALGDDHHAQAHHAHGVGGGASSQPPSRGVNTSRFTLQPQSFYGGVTDLAAPNRPAAAATGHFTPPAEPSRHLVAQRVSAAEASLSQLHRGLRTMLSPASVAAPSATHGAAAQKRSAARIAELEAKVADLADRPGSRKRRRSSAGSGSHLGASEAPAKTSDGAADLPSPGPPPRALVPRRSTGGGDDAEKQQRLFQLQGQVEALKTQLDEAGLLRVKAQEEHNLELQSMRSEVEKVRRQLQFMTSEEESTRKRLRTAEKSALAARHEHAAEVRKLQASMRTLRMEAQQSQEKASALARDLRATEASASSVARDSDAVRTAQRRIEQLQQQLVDAQQGAGRAARFEARAEAAEAQLRAAPQTEAQTQTVARLRRQVNDLMAKHQAAAAEVRRLQGEQESSEVLQEKVRSAEAKATRLEQAAMAGQRYRVQAEALRMDAQHWDSEFRSILRDLGKLTTETEGHGGAGSAAKPAAAASRVTPERVLQVLQDLRMERAVMLRAQGIADANTASARREAAASASRIVDLESELAEAQERMLTAESKCIVAERKVQWLTRERDSLKKLCETFEEADATMRSGAGSKDEQALAAARAATTRAQQRVVVLEQELQEAKSRASKAVSEATAATPNAVHARAKARIASLQEQVKALQAKNQSLTTALTKAERDAAYLEAQVGRGDFKRSTTKVLHLSMNPTRTALANKRTEQARTITELTNRVVELEKLLANAGGSASSAPGDSAAGGNSAAAAVPASGPTSTSVAVGATADLTKKIQRLKEAFREKTTAFREAVYLLTGFKIDMSGGSRQGVGAQLRLRSMYGEREEDWLLFKMKEGGGLELLESEFTQRLEAKVFTYLTTCHSIPAFLSNLTLELFEKQTFMPLAD